MSGKRNCLVVRIFGVPGAVTEGPIAIGALVLIVLFVVQVLWGRQPPLTHNLLAAEAAQAFQSSRRDSTARRCYLAPDNPVIGRLPGRLGSGTNEEHGRGDRTHAVHGHRALRQ
jgi:hypothetical protein